jgi:hypothetical protein
MAFLSVSVFKRLIFIILACLHVIFQPVESAFSISKSTHTPPRVAVATTTKSIGQAIQDALTYEDLLNVASQMWLPTDENLPPHFSTQLVHHEKRQRWASQLLTKLSVSAECNTSDDGKPPTTSTNNEWKTDPRLERVILAAALSFQLETTASSSDRPDKEGRFIADSLKALHGLVGRQFQNAKAENSKAQLSLSANSIFGITTLLERAVDISNQLSLKDVCEIRWAARGLQARLKIFDDHQLELDLNKLDQRVDRLPFDVIPLGVDWNELLLLHNKQGDPVVPLLRDSIPFAKDTIVTRSGSEVQERRGTAWVADEGIGALAYSGKLMPPRSIPSFVKTVMRAAEEAMDIQEPFFDCALCNHYPDGDSACKFHTDPEHGTLWDRTTVVVAAGEDRKFAFRPIAEFTSWNKWENEDLPLYSATSGRHDDEQANHLAAVSHLFAGDIVCMKDQCNDVFYHAVHAADSVSLSPKERISLVLKRSLDRGGGKRGHGLQGEGRRSRKAANKNK